MARVTLDIDAAQIERVLDFGAVRARFAKAQARRGPGEIPTLNAADLGLQAIPVDGSDVPVLDMSQLEILPFDD